MYITIVITSPELRPQQNKDSVAGVQKVHFDY